MVNWKMKNIFIYAQKDIKNLVFFDKETKLHILSPNNLPLPNNSNKNTNYLIIDADYAGNDLEKIIITYQKYKTICFAFTKDASKNNILKLYSLGIDNVLRAPININELIQNIITPNKDFNVNFDEQDDNSKKVLIFPVFLKVFQAIFSIIRIPPLLS